MFARILLLLLISPIVELALLLQLGRMIGFWPTIALIVVTAVAGSFLLKHQGLSVWGDLKRRLGRGELPGDQIVDGVIILVCGALLVTPGVLTDIIGFAGLIPVTRIPIRKYLMRRFTKSLTSGTVTMGFGTFGGADFDYPPPPEPGSDWHGQGSSTPRYASRDDEDADDNDRLKPPATDR